MKLVGKVLTVHSTFHHVFTPVAVLSDLADNA